MRTLLGLLAVLSSVAANATDVGDIAVLDDPTGVIHGGMMLSQTFCKETAKRFYGTHNDNYDGLVTFTTKYLDDIMGVEQGTPVKSEASGIGTDQVGVWNNPANYGSAGKLGQCVFMASLPKLPDHPDGGVAALFGLPLGITGVELLAHEYGHHWLLWVSFDKNDGLGKRDLLRGDEGNGANGHYNYFANSHSVMYGGFIIDNQDGTFTVRGGDRKYGELDQYLMGLREASEVPPLFYVDDGTDAGNPSAPIPKNGNPTTETGQRVDVSIDDVIRAMGPRVPSAANAQHCWRVGFVLVAEPGTTVTAAQIAKVEEYRETFVDWFHTVGTDGRGTVDTRLVAQGGCLEAGGPDAGSGADAGAAADAGSADAGGGAPVDGGSGELGPDAGSPGTATDEADAGKYDPWADTGKLRPDCGCHHVASGLGLMGAFALLAFLRARKRERI